jgi:hypothetical protein
MEKVDFESKSKSYLDKLSQNAPNIEISAKQILTTFLALVLVSVWVSPISASAAQEDLIVSVADPGIQFYSDSGLTTDAPVLVETFDNAQWQYECIEYVWDEYLQEEYCTNSEDRFQSSVGQFSTTWGYFYEADRWGGAGGAGRYASAGEILLTVSDQSDYRYLGFWWSAGSIGNDVQLLDNDNTVLATFTVDDDDPNSDEDLLGVTADEAYTHNPNRNISDWQTWEKYAFVHLRYPPGFRKVRFISSGNGFEFDNVTISTEVPDFADSETTTETFTPYELSTPGILLADPRTGEIAFPGITLAAGTGEVNAMICISQVQNSNGDAIATPLSPTLQSNGPVTGAITSSTDTNLQTFSGPRSSIEAFSADVFFSPIALGEAFNIVGSRFLRITATPQTNAGAAGCTGSAADSEIIEIRFVNIIQRNSVGIRID